MNAERIEQLSKEPELAHIRVWLRGDEVSVSEMAVLLGSLSRSERVTFEFWDVRDASLRRLRQAGIPMDTGSASGGPLLYSIEREELSKVLGSVLSESFGLWLGIAEDEVRKMAAEAATKSRAQALPPEGRFIISSLYDDNFEVFGRDITDLELVAEVDEAMERIPPDAAAPV